MKIFLDDERIPPKNWILASTAKEAISLLNTGEVKEISLDHDLGDNQGTGYEVILWLEEMVATTNFKPPKVLIHSANPSAKQKMEAGIKSIKKLYSSRVKK